MVPVELLSPSPDVTNLYFKQLEDMVLYYKGSTPSQVQDTLQQQPVFNAHTTAVAVFNILYDTAGKVSDFEVLMLNMFLINASGFANQNMTGKRYSEVLQHIVPNELLDNLKEVAATGRSSCFELGYTSGAKNYCFR
ncbi:hypothetical protein WG947_07615 [Pontibacter sp. H259]|uniref:hypothetical protein n=1 Tax=Pontibacter sp. H259 TaxID=3133421 RepID=UPI0030BF3C98